MKWKKGEKERVTDGWMGTVRIITTVIVVTNTPNIVSNYYGFVVKNKRMYELLDVLVFRIF